MTPLPPQSPDQAPRYRFSPRSDRYQLPTFREPMARREYVEPVEIYDPRNEPRPFSWSELADPQLWLSSGLAVALLVIGLIVVLSSGPQPS